MISIMDELEDSKRMGHPPRFMVTVGATESD
jgi:hypothetical protein